jgi:hypothetical protein
LALKEGRRSIANGEAQNPRNVGSKNRGLIFAVKVARIVSSIGPRTRAKPAPGKGSVAGETEGDGREEKLFHTVRDDLHIDSV